MSKTISLTALMLAASLAAPIAQAQTSQSAANPDKSELARLCKGCAWVSNVHREERKGKASGLGVVGGAVVGGLLGNRVGRGNGRALATVGGAAAGGYAGNEIEKNAKTQQVWVVRLINKDGSHRTHEQAANPNLRPGDQVVLVNGQLERR